MEALYFDGRSARGEPVRLALAGGELMAQGEQILHRWPLAEVQWPERTRYGQRVLQLRSGGSLQVADATAFDLWRRQAGAAGAADSWVVRAQQSWRATAAAVLLLLLLLGVGWRCGVPWAAGAVLVAVPPAVDEAVGSAALQSLETRWLKPSQLSAQRQAQLRAEFAAAVAQAYPAGDAPHWALQFRAADKALGPNALALPGGTLIVTDALVALLQDQDDTLVGVLAHELGHLRHRHGMRGVIQAGLVGAVTSLALGDFSSLLAGVPAVMAQLSYSRDAERQADAEAVRVLRASGRSPAAMALLFERLKTTDAERDSLPTALASHPMDEDRMRYFRDAVR
jgi:Zn-dependent protease with chaperone function